MSLTSSMLVGFTGINSNSIAVDTVGNNLANLNTTAFKGQRTLFETLMFETISEGQPPSEQSGGTLPNQVGFGVGIASLQRNFTQGGIDGTGVQSDLAVSDGDGFFILQDTTGDVVYTRDGSFRLNENQTLVSANGSPVQVFQADASGNISTGSLGNLVIPLGSAGPAVATSQVTLDGRLDPTTNLASAGAIVASQPLITTTGTAATAATALTDLGDASGLPLFTTGDELAVTGSKGGVAITDSTFVIGTTGNTVGDLAAHLESVLGIDPTGTGTPGVSISDGTVAPAGALVIRSNVGVINAVQLDAGSIVNKTGVVASPFSFETVSEAVGDGVTTSFGVFDSLGNQLDVRLRLVLESKSTGGNTWRFFAESTNDSDLSPLLGSGTVSFDGNGQFVSATGTTVTVDRAGAGSASPLTLSLDFSGVAGLAATDAGSEVVMASQNGAPPGVMTAYSIGADGVVTGAFSNQQTQALGQVALATFPNREGLVAMGENTFSVGPNSGTAAVVAPRTAGSGTIVAGALEQSNVQIAREFVNLITASTGISSASRVVRVADDLLQELLLIAR